MLQQPHLLIAGATGSGKSVVINGMMTTALKDSPAAVQFILIDPKRVELVDYKELPHTLRYSSEPGEMVQALQEAIAITDNRYRDMARQHVKKYGGGAVYVVIDELADLMTTNKKQVQPILQRLCQIGRAANVHVVAATQCPLSAVIPTPIKVNFDSRVALRTRSVLSIPYYPGFLFPPIFYYVRGFCFVHRYIVQPASLRGHVVALTVSG